MDSDNYPSGWATYSSYISAYGHDRFAFKASIGDVNRFAARFRLAASFTGLTLSGYGEATESGYGGLFKVFLCWSAMESFMDVMGLDVRSLDPISEKYGGSSVSRTISSLDDESKFYSFICNRVNKTHKKELCAFLSGEDFNILYLASSIRHIFAHGTLTANVSGVKPEIVANICDELSNLLIKIMDGEFNRIVQDEVSIMACER